jgi:hypothetical protein
MSVELGLRLKVFENRMLRRIFGPKRVEIIEGWIKLRNWELHNLYSSPNVIALIQLRAMRLIEHVECVKEKRNAHKVLVRKPERKRRLRKPRRGWEDNIKMD